EVLRKVEYAEDATLAESRETAASRHTAAGAEDSGPGPGTLMQNLVRAELEQMRQESWFASLFNNTWVLVGLLILVVAGGFLWFRDADPERKFQAGMALLQQPEGPDWMRAKTDYFEPLLASDPKKWRDRLEEPMQQIENYAAKRKILRWPER